MSRRRGALVTAAATALALVAAGCDAGVRQGGDILGPSLTVSMVTTVDGPGRDALDGAKLALHQSGGRFAGFTVNLNAWDQHGEALDERMRQLLSDTQVVAVLGPFDGRAAATVVPLVNAAGILEVAPRTLPGSAPGDPQLNPSGRTTLVLGDADPAFDAGAFRALFGRAPGRDAALGYGLMRIALGAVRAAGTDAARRQVVIDRALRSR